MTKKRPWLDEPDELHGEFCGIKWEIVRNKEMGNLLGYAKIPSDHHLHDADYMDPRLQSLNVHGGLTYSKTDPKDGRTVFGFDCAHYSDLTPGMEKFIPNYLNNHTDDIYRDINYVKNECLKLCWQLAGNTLEGELNKALFDQYKVENDNN